MPFKDKKNRTIHYKKYYKERIDKGVCIQCGKPKNLKDSKYRRCYKCRATQKYLEKKRSENPHYLEKRRNHKFKVRYGLSTEQVKIIIEKQFGLCPICKTSLQNLPQKQVHVDHDHILGKVRGIICAKCNRLLGDSQDNILILESAIRYLQGGK